MSIEETTENARALMLVLQKTGRWKDLIEYTKEPVTRPVAEPVAELIKELACIRRGGRDGRPLSMRDAIELASCSLARSSKDCMQVQELRKLAEKLWHTKLASGAQYFVGNEALRLVELARHLEEGVYYEKDGKVYPCRLMAARFRKIESVDVVEFDLRCREIDLGWTTVLEGDWLEGRSGIIWPKTH